MITAIDTCVLLDIFQDDPIHGATSLNAVRRCLKEGSVVASDAVWAETAACFTTMEHFTSTMEKTGIRFDPLSAEAVAVAGETWRHYRSGGGSRIRVLADFLIAAHAFHQCDRLLTRDRGFYRTYFDTLTILDPTL